MGDLMNGIDPLIAVVEHLGVPHHKAGRERILFQLIHKNFQIMPGNGVLIDHRTVRGKAVLSVQGDISVKINALKHLKSVLCAAGGDVKADALFL